METLKVETIATETLKPSSPTKQNTEVVNLSVYDQFLPPVYTVAILFFTTRTHHEHDQTHTTSLKLKTSLSETLTRFYPFAGKFHGGVSIDCNDEGALFSHAHTDSALLDSLKSPDFSALQRFLPLDVVQDPYEAASTWPLLLVKATYFRCGGLAIGICISHKIADAASISSFIAAWAATARGDSDAVSSPEFTAAKFFPPASYSARSPREVKPNRKLCVTKRFVFDASKMEDLRDKAASETVSKPTRVESVTALLWRCLNAASKPSGSDTFLPKKMFQPVNLRPKVPSLLSENVIGNVMYSSMALNTDQEGKTEIQETVKELRRKREELENLIKEDDEGSLPSSATMMIGTKLAGLMFNDFSRLSYETHEMYSLSSWCKIPLYETADFGWGIPVWVAGNVAPAIDNNMVLIDTKDGKGIEAWITLPQHHMSLFEQDSELLAFASSNPSVFV